MIAISSRSQPAPMPKRNRPPLKRSRVETSLASSSGCRSGTMPVPSLMRLVTPDARPSATNGSMKCAYDSGITPSAEPGKRLALCTGMNGCSAHQNDSKPSSSTFRAMNPTSTRYAGRGMEIPTFMVSAPWSPLAREPGGGQRVRLPLDLVVDLRGRVERALQHAPARHPVPGPAGLVLGNGPRLLQLDAAEVEILGAQGLDLRNAREVADEVADVRALVGID